jgi:hypothetical protein
VSSLSGTLASGHRMSTILDSAGPPEVSHPVPDLFVLKIETHRVPRRDWRTRVARCWRLVFVLKQDGRSGGLVISS